MSRIAIIPARGGSKRIPHKNIRPFLGKPMIAYSIEAALTSGLFDEVMVSTDDPEIAEIALQYGAKVPFMRSATTSDDYATLADVVHEVITRYAANDRCFDAFCCILATAPLLTPERLREGVRLMEEEGFESVFPVLKFSYPIQRSLQITDGRATLVYPEFATARSQDLPARYHDSGQFYWMHTGPFMELKTLFTAHSGAIILSETEVQDIDTEEDWTMAEIKYKRMFESPCNPDR